MSDPLFEIDDLRVATPSIAHGNQSDGLEGPTERNPILEGVSLTIGHGEVHALMGPNGSGKSTLASAILGSPECEVVGGRILFKADDITDWGPDVRAKAGLFLAFQYPQEIGGVSVLSLLRQALSARKGIEMGMLELRRVLTEWMDKLDMDHSFLERSVNDGLSCEEKKRNEILQMAVLEPELAILDESDSGLDDDALAAVAEGVAAVQVERPELGILAITRSQRLLDYLRPDRVHVLLAGRIVASGGLELARQIERDGYESFR